MPIYEYQCSACRHEMEALQKISDPQLTECPVCHESALKKRISAAGFRLKGQGWYETDFKSGNKKNLSGGQEKSDAAPGKPKSSSESKAS